VINFLDSNSVAWFIFGDHAWPEMTLKVVAINKAVNCIAVNFDGSDPNGAIFVFYRVRSDRTDCASFYRSIVCPIYIVNIKGDVLNKVTMLGDQSCHGVSGADWGAEKELDIVLLKQITNFVLDSGFETVVTNDIEPKGVLVKECGLSRI
jgi:hypothetical protein